MSTLKPSVNAGDHHKGNINATITLVEYGDFECPYCGRAHPLVNRLIKEMGEELDFVFRNFPLQEIHPHAYMSALAAEAAGKQNKYWEMHDLIFGNQERLDTNFLMTLAEDLDLNMQQFTKDLESKELENKIEMDFESGIHSGVNGTPSFYLNGVKLLTYDESYESLLNAVLRKLKKQEY